MKTLLLLLCLAIPAFAQDEYIRLKTEYDRFADEMRIQTENFTVWQNGPYHRLSLAVLTSYEGSRPAAPLIGMAFTLIAKPESFMREPALYVIADGERLKLGTLQHYGEPDRIIGSVYSLSMGTVFPFAVLRKIVTAKNVELRLGEIEFRLATPQMDALKRLARTFDAQIK